MASRTGTHTWHCASRHLWKCDSTYFEDIQCVNVHSASLQRDMCCLWVRDEGQGGVVLSARSACTSAVVQGRLVLLLPGMAVVVLVLPACYGSGCSQQIWLLRLKIIR